MTLEKYRILHSTLLEKYQWIERELEGLYAVLSDEHFCQALREIEKDSIGGVVREIKKIEKEKDIVIFSQEEYEELDKIRERRNFWSHVCYTEPYDKHTGAPRNGQMLSADLQEAQAFLEHLRQIKEIHMTKNRDKIIDSLFC